jgi:4-amino-4-deoxy-L-arabinose transferase-like glycosyltransferase
MKLFAFLIVLTVLRLVYIGRVELSPDEAQYYQWSQRLDWCYFSKGPGVAATIWASTSLFGPSEFGVRAFAPLLALGTSLLLYWLAKRIYDQRVATWTVVLLNFTPLFHAGGLIMTIDPLSIFFWSAALCTLWLALEKSPAFSLWWPLSGALIGLGFLCKWTNAAMLLSVLLLLLLTPRFRRELLRPGFYSMLLLFLPALIPIWIWQDRNDWPILHHLASRGGLETPWWQIGIPDFLKFVGSHFLAYSPLIFAAMLIALFVASKDSLPRWGRAFLRAIVVAPRGLVRHWAIVLFIGLLALAFFFAGNFWEEPGLHKLSKLTLAIALLAGIARCKEAANIHWKSRFLVAFALPLVLGYTWIALHHDAEVNWTAPAAAGLFLLTAAYWVERASRRWITWTLSIAGVMVVLGAEPDLVRAAGVRWPLKNDHTARLRQWKETARVVHEFRQKMEAIYPQPLFLIGENYGVASELCYYLPPRPPEFPGHPACYVPEAVVPENQYHFWPRYDEYQTRTTRASNPDEENSEIGTNPYVGRTALYITTREKEKEPPDVVVDTFEEWKLGGEFHIKENGQHLRLVRIFICHRYRPGLKLN